MAMSEPRSPSSGSTANVFYRDRRGEVHGAWWAAVWLNQWMGDAELWDLLESLDPVRLARFGAIVQNTMIAQHGSWGPWKKPEQGAQGE